MPLRGLKPLESGTSLTVNDTNELAPHTAASMARGQPVWPRVEAVRSSRTALRLRAFADDQPDALADAAHTTPDRERPGVQVDIFPVQPQHLAPQAGTQGYVDERLASVVADNLEEPS
jgi:hypothetical protein